MNRRGQATLAGALAAIAALAGAGCESKGPQVASRGAQLFAERCGGCHTLRAAGTEGSISGERPTGPNLDNIKETKDQVLFAIRNGGFSGAIMPQNIVVGEDAEAIAEFVAEYAGREAKSPPSPRGNPAPSGESSAESERSSPGRKRSRGRGKE